MLAPSKNTVRDPSSPRLSCFADDMPDLEVAHLERKIRLLTLASLGFQKVGQNVQYSQVAETLQVDVSEVEKWVIDGG